MELFFRQGLDDDTDDQLIDDPHAILAQHPLPPPGVNRHTHDLVLKTIQGGQAWRATRDAEILSWRNRRLLELQGRNTLPALEARTVGAEALIECLKRAKGFVVVHVTDGLETCNKIDRFIAILEQRRRTQPSDWRGQPSSPLDFLRLEAKEAGGALHDVDPDALPALLVYRDAELQASKCKADFEDVDQFEDYLDDLGVFEH